MRDVAIIGVGAHPTGKFLDKPLKALAHPAIWGALDDAGVKTTDINVAYVGNSLGGLLTGQEGVRGQVVLQHSGITGIPIVNVENACASAMTALRGAWLEVASGAADVALAVGVEKMNVGDSARTIGALSGVSELDLSELGMQFTTSYAIHPKINLKSRMEEYGWTTADFAKPAVKNSYNGSLNPLAQHRKPLTIEEVVQSRVIVDPLTLLMCSSISDGAAAAVVCSADIAKRFSSKTPITIASCVLQSGVYRLPNDTRPDSATTSAYAAYEKAGSRSGRSRGHRAARRHGAFRADALRAPRPLRARRRAEADRRARHYARRPPARQSERRPVLARPSGRRHRSSADLRVGLADARRSG